MAQRPIIVALKDPFEWMGNTVTEIAVREPKGGEYATFGEPVTYVRHRDGQAYTIEQSLVIGQYLDRCLQLGSKPIDGGAVVLDMMSLQDAKRVRAALLGFFTDADLAILAEKQKSLSSTSTA